MTVPTAIRDVAYGTVHKDHGKVISKKLRKPPTTGNTIKITTLQIGGGNFSAILLNIRETNSTGINHRAYPCQP
jgi:hypothetical protein